MRPLQACLGVALLVLGCGDSEGSGGAGASGGGSGGGASGAGGALPNGSCHDDNDCDNFSEFCLAPGEDEGCGACYDPVSPCASDDECQPLGENFACLPVECSCDGGGAECAEGCGTDADCGAVGTVCSATHHCVAQPCASDDECPVNFSCDGQSCARILCASDDECAGACVNQFCYEALGDCTELPV